MLSQQVLLVPALPPGSVFRRGLIWCSGDIYFFPIFPSVVKNNGLDYLNCSSTWSYQPRLQPPGRSTDQENGELVLQGAPGSQKRGVTGMESEDWRPPQDWGTGREPRHICDPGECVWPGVTVCSGPPRAGARKDGAAQHLGSCFLSLLLISGMGFNPSTIRHFLS